MDIQNALAVVLPVAGVVVWLIRLEGRVNTNEALQRKMAEDVSYIRERVDRAVNGHSV
jgi:sensor domain CHASE-containing protein